VLRRRWSRQELYTSCHESTRVLGHAYKRGGTCFAASASSGRKGVAIHFGPEFCVGHREVQGEA